MSPAPFRTVLVGAGKIGLGYARDPLTARHYRYSTHAQVLAEHPDFRWVAVVDPSPQAREEATGRWKVPAAFATAAEAADSDAEVAVLATPPGDRVGLLDAFPRLRAVLVEKPLGADPASSRAFLDACRRRGLKVQVNLWRRADPRYRALAAGELRERVGAPQAIFGLYGNGLRNNGIHLIDLARMLFGDASSARAIGPAGAFPPGPVPGDVNVPFALEFAGGIVAAMQPLDFRQYREIALDVWGSKGRLSILQEGLRTTFAPMAGHRALTGEREIDTDRTGNLDTTVGEALRHVYTDLADALRTGGPTFAPGETAESAEAIAEAVAESARSGGRTLRRGSDGAWR